MYEKEKQDIMSAEEILDELKKLAADERTEEEAGAEEDAKLLDEAIVLVERFISAEEKEENVENPEEKESPLEKTEVVDTGTLTGPLPALKNFLIKKSQDNAAK